MEWFRQVGRTAAERLESMSPVLRWALVGLVATVLVAAMLLGSPGARRADTFLISKPLPASQLTAVEAALAKAGLTDYQLEGRRIKVPSAVKDRYLATLLHADVLPRDFGELLDAAIDAGSPFDSREQKTARIRNARQRELAQIIAEIKGIESARVLYDQGDSGGIGRQKILTASVSVTPAANQSLSLKQVRSIRNLVASAIAGLEPHQVSVTDLYTGRNYAGMQCADAVALAEIRAEYKRNVEHQWRQKILEALAWIPGIEANVDMRLRQQQPSGSDRDPQWQPAAAKVTLHVPRGYVDKVWRKRNRIADDARAPITPARAVTDLGSELAAHLKSHVTDLVPPGVRLDLKMSLHDGITTTNANSAGTEGRSATGLPRPAWPLIGLTLFAGVGMVALRWLQHTKVAAVPEAVEVEIPDVDVLPPEPTAPAPIDPLAEKVAQLQAEADSKVIVPARQPADESERVGSWVRANSRLVPGPHVAGLDLNDLAPSHPAPANDGGSTSAQAPVNRPFDYLNEASAADLARFLEQESSQVIAVVFSRLDPAVAAEVLKCLPAALQVDVVRRLESLDEISEEVTREIEGSLQSWFADQLLRSQRRNAGKTAVKQILQIAGNKTRRQIAQRMHSAGAAPADVNARRVAASGAKTPANSFDSVLQLDDNALCRVLGAAEPQDVVLALAGSERQVIDRVLRNMKPREADRLREAFQALDPSRLNDVARSQQTIAEIAGHMRNNSRPASSAAAAVATA
jgi:type III secretory pathway lipoprotein EscJ